MESLLEKISVRRWAKMAYIRRPFNSQVSIFQLAGLQVYTSETGAKTVYLHVSEFTYISKNIFIILLENLFLCFSRLFKDKHELTLHWISPTKSYPNGSIML